MVNDLRYAYLIGDGILAIVWVLVFMLRPDLRRKILIMSILIAPLAPLMEVFYLRDYWRPEFFNGWIVGIEDPLFGFFFGGISCVLYEELFRKHIIKKHVRPHPLLITILVLAGFVWMIVFNLMLGINSMYASIFGLLVDAIVILLMRRDLRTVAVVSGTLLSVLFFLLYLLYLCFFPDIFQAWWMLKNLSGIFFGKVPIEELIWAFSWGLFVGPAYEFATGVLLGKSVKIKLAPKRSLSR